MFLHLYQNNVDEKEHLAIVFGDQIHSRSLDAPQPGETEKTRMTRGAYTGRLYPGRISSRVDSQSPNVDNGGPRSAPAPENYIKALSPLVRIHSECYTGETAWSARCDCGEQLDEAARLMSLPSSTGGVIVYLRQEGRGIGLGEKLKAYNLQDLGSDTVEANLLLRHPADARSYGLATAILVDLGLGGDTGIRLLTNNPDKVRAVEGSNREIVVKERVAMVPLAWKTGGRKGIHSEELENYLRVKVKSSFSPLFDYQTRTKIRLDWEDGTHDRMRYLAYIFYIPVQPSIERGRSRGRHNIALLFLALVHESNDVVSSSQTSKSKPLFTFNHLFNRIDRRSAPKDYAMTLLVFLCA